MGLYHFPADLAQFVDELAGQRGDPGALARRVLELSDGFVGRSEWQAGYAADPELRHAYLRYYLPVNIPKIGVPLSAWLASSPRRIAGRAIRVVDLGSGPGSALLGVLERLRRLAPEERPASLHVVALDQSFETLRDAERLVARLAATIPGLAVSFRALRTDLVGDRTEVFPLAAADGRFDLVLASNVLCEVARAAGNRDAACELVRAAADVLLADGGALLIVEPASRDVARDLHHVRDRLLASERLHALAPCLHDLPCPALRNERDWCIHHLAWEPPPAVRDIDRRTGLRKGALKFAYLALSAEPPTPVPAGRWRVVSDVLEMKGERRVYLCSDGRWIVLGQLKRDESSEAARAFAGLTRGDLVEIDGMEQKGSLHRLPPGGRLRALAE